LSNATPEFSILSPGGGGGAGKQDKQREFLHILL
jgi:hypothetical protein